MEIQYNPVSRFPDCPSCKAGGENITLIQLPSVEEDDYWQCTACGYSWKPGQDSQASASGTSA